MHRLFLAFGSVSAFLGVAGGAFGAHLLRERIPGDLLSAYETAVQYQLLHAVALLFVGLAAQSWPRRRWETAGWLFVAGSVLFCGSLYVLSLTGVRSFGAVTPLGGLCFLAGWAVAVSAAVRSTRGQA